jgi:hypothetical protein
MSFKSVDIIGNNSSRDQFDWFFIYKWLQMLFSVHDVITAYQKMY